MAGLPLEYMSVRTLVWMAAAIAMGISNGRTAGCAETATSLSVAIAGLTGLFASNDLWRVITIIAEEGTFYLLVFHFLDALCNGLFLLMHHGHGCRITVRNLVELPSVVGVLPTVYFISALTFSWLLTLTKVGDRTRFEIYVALVSGLVQAAIAIMSWLTVLENSERVAKYLESIAPRPTQTQVSDATFQLSEDDDNEGFQAVQEEITTVAEEVDRMSQAALMRNFKTAVTAYMILFVIAFFAPVYGQETNAALIIVITWNILLLLVLCALAWVFRPRATENPYLFVGEDEERNVHLDTRIEMTGMPMIPELPDEMPEGGSDTNATSSPVRQPVKLSSQTAEANGACGAESSAEEENGFEKASHKLD